MTLRLSTLLLVALGGSVRSAWAQDSLSFDPTVTAVVSGGRWTANGRTGYYRLVVRSRGVDHATSALVIEWLADPSRGAGTTIVQSVAVKELSGMGRLDRPQIGQFLKGWRAWIQLTDPQGGPGSQTTRAIDLGPPGEFKVKQTQ